MKLAAIQLRQTVGDVPGNLQHAAEFAARAADDGAELALLPELFSTGYLVGSQLFELWEPDDGRTVTWMQETASRHRMLVAGSLPERREDRLFNTLFLVEPNGQTHRYAKRRPTKVESAAFDPGHEVGIIATSYGRAGCVVCADLNWKASLLQPMAGRIDFLLCAQATTIPRRIARAAVEREQKRGEPWFAPLARAVGAPIVSATLVGPVQRLSRIFSLYLCGGSWIIDADGRGIANVGFDEEGVAIGDVAVGSTGGDARSSLFRDPGFALRLESLLTLNLGDLRPTAVS